MKQALEKIREEFLDLLGTISGDELASNLKLRERLTLIFSLLERTYGRGVYA